MKVKSLAKALKRIQRFTSTRSSDTMNSAVTIHSEYGKTVLTVGDGDVFVSLSLNDETDQQNELKTSVSAKTITDMMASFDRTEVSNVDLEVINDRLKITSPDHGFEYQLLCMPWIERTTAFNPITETYEINRASLIKGLKHVSHSVSKDPYRQSLSQPQIQLKNGSLRLLSSDGPRASIAVLTNFDDRAEFQCLIPQSIVNVLELAESENISLQLANDTIKISSDDLEIYCLRRIESLHQYEHVNIGGCVSKAYEQSASCPIQFNRKALVSVVTSVIDKKDREITVTIEASKSHQKVFVTGINGTAEIGATVTEDCLTTLRYEFLLSCLKSSNAKSMEIRFLNDGSASISSSDGLSTLIMPIVKKSDDVVFSPVLGMVKNGFIPSKSVVVSSDQIKETLGEGTPVIESHAEPDHRGSTAAIVRESVTTSPALTAIANHLSCDRADIVRVEEWEHVYFVIVKGRRPRFVSKEVIRSMIIPWINDHQSGLSQVVNEVKERNRWEKDRSAAIAA